MAENDSKSATPKTSWEAWAALIGISATSTAVAQYVSKNPIVSLSVAGGTALADFPAVHAALETLAASCGAIRFERFSLLLRAPELQTSTAEAAAAALLDVHLRKNGPAEADLARWLELAESGARLRNLGAVAALQRLHGVKQTGISSNLIEKLTSSIL